MWIAGFVVAATFLCCICVFSIWYASTHFHKVYYTISSSKIEKPLDFVVLADLHDQIYGKENETLLAAIAEEHPSAILIAGDMLTALQNREKTAETLIAKLSQTYPVYYGLGNHEAKMKWKQEMFGKMYEQYFEDIHQTGAQVLDDSFAQFHDTIRIYGLNMGEVYYKRLKQTPMEDDYIEQKIGKAQTQYFNILLAHNPMYFAQYADWKPDLVLSGHVHGGLVRLPFLGGVIAPNLHLFPKYDGGKFQKDQTTMIVSRGLGIHSVEFRMWNTAELVVVRIVPEKE